MSYRKINVNGASYEYVVGKSYLKVKGVGVWPREKVGYEIERKRNKYMVTPAVVAELIGKGPEVFTCEHKTTTKWVWNPFDLEIHGKFVKMIDCDECVDEVRRDI
jgi:hypothetical protein